MQSQNRIFDDIAKQLPDGVYLTAISQNGHRLRFEGVAQSSTRVSAFMRNIDGSSYLKNPELEIVQTNERGTVGAAFVLYAEQSGSAGEPESAPNKPKRRIASGG